MKILTPTTALLGSVVALAAPVEVDKRSTFGDITEHPKTSPTVSSLNLTYQTNAGEHGTPREWKDLHVAQIAAQKGGQDGQFIDWKTFKSNGVNVGAWMEQEKTHSEAWWNALAPSALDEWNLCLDLGDRCGPVLEERYSTLYAIEEYGMHVIIGLHSLPGGNQWSGYWRSLWARWFQNCTNLDYSFQAVRSILNFIERSGHLNGFTIAPLNEASDTNLVGFGSCAGLTADGTNWITTYVKGVLAMVSEVDGRIPIMLQDCFCGAAFRSRLFGQEANLVVDSHVREGWKRGRLRERKGDELTVTKVYYFAASGVYAQYVSPAICGQASVLTSNSTFPVFVGEWSLQTMYNNTLDYRKTLFDTQRYAWQHYASGGAFWTYNSTAVDPVDGEGITEDYWSYGLLIDEGVITVETNSSYC
ncbi:hypothetical protein H2203_008836 [Taxawa tesnikishii (nom. ined.)]|nr:hypothetical protein H2203_008836 [Dothideales sp. JES 119]